MHSKAMAGVIIAGGEGRRLGGVVKPLLRVGGVPILETLVKRFGNTVSPLIISTGQRGTARFDGFGAAALVPDRADADGGPLAGLFAAVAHLEVRGRPPEFLLSLAGDCPDLPADLADRLAAEMTPDTDVVFAGFAGQAYPPNALWRFAALAAERAALGGDPQGRGPRQLVAAARRRDMDFSVLVKVNPFEGLNTLADLVRVARAGARKNA